MIRMTPSGTPFTAPLHEILPGHGPTLRYGYVYVYVYSYFYNPVHLHRRHYHCKDCTPASRYRMVSHQLSDNSPVIGIRSFASHSFRLDLTHDFQFY